MTFYTSQGRLVPLLLVESGRVARIVDICAGPGLKRRLMQLGFMPGQQVEVIQNVGFTVVVRLSNGAVIVLSKGIAQKILVEI